VVAQVGTSILDVGGGTGRNAQMFRDAGAWVVVCDSSLEMLRCALARDLPVVCADAARLPFASGAFERASVVDAFHHFVDPSPEVAQTRAVVELLRILIEGGQLILEELDTRHWQVRLIAAIEWSLLMGSRFLSPEILVDRVESEGGRCERLVKYGLCVGLVFRKVTEGHS
jgi:ubiquinone/menaquinone biosynthesis C-methylase UbiE